MVRTQLYLPAPLHARLRRLARERRTTVSDLVRQALEREYAGRPGTDTWQRAVDAVTGLWGDREDLDEGFAREVRAGSRRLDEIEGERRSAGE